MTHNDISTTPAVALKALYRCQNRGQRVRANIISTIVEPNTLQVSVRPHSRATIDTTTVTTEPTTKKRNVSSRHNLLALRDKTVTATTEAAMSMKGATSTPRWNGENIGQEDARSKRIRMKGEEARMHKPTMIPVIAP